MESCKFFQQLISGVSYLHKIGCAHRDIKPSNILIDSDYNLKIIDFGLGNLYSDDEKLKTACGSPCYAAPEVRKDLKLNIRLYQESDTILLQWIYGPQGSLCSRCYVAISHLMKKASHYYIRRSLPATTQFQVMFLLKQEIC